MTVYIGTAEAVVSALMKFISEEEEVIGEDIVLALDMPESGDENILVMNLGPLSFLSEEKAEILNIDSCPDEITSTYIKDENGRYHSEDGTPVYKLAAEKRENFYSKGRPDAEGKNNGYEFFTMKKKEKKEDAFSVFNRFLSGPGKTL